MPAAGTSGRASASRDRTLWHAERARLRRFPSGGSAAEVIIIEWRRADPELVGNMGGTAAPVSRPTTRSGGLVDGALSGIDDRSVSSAAVSVTPRPLRPCGR